ncbi:uncharacterized protein VP01_1301g5 [Puccinia sorghi]|uniref:Retrotransposon gag domain-containing protein n=1 Tax=Puccinia sorghi TaxID=27349 RepID=A0A0L6VN32_9BASI|nr:uncharacterized protein VP01_1301g5 [Puccinia sorghi]
MPNDWPRRKLSNRLRTPRLTNKTPLPLNQIPLLLLPPTPWCLPNPNPLMGPVAFVGQIGLHAVTYAKQFPTNTSKVVFTILFMKDYTATWSQPYLDKVFNKPVVLNEFLNNFRSSFFDHDHWHRAMVGTSARLEPCQPTCRTSTSTLW